MGSQQSVRVANAFPQDIFVKAKTERITVDLIITFLKPIKSMKIIRFDQ